MYAVVAVGDIDLVPDEETSPISWFIETVVAPTTFQVKVADCPALRLLGVAVKAVMIGLLVNVTVTDLFTEPELLVAVRV